MGDAASVELIAAALIQAGRLPEGGDVQEAIWDARGRFENPYLAARCVSLLGSVDLDVRLRDRVAAHLADDEPSEGFVAAAEVLLDELAPEHLARLQEIALATRDAIDLATRATDLLSRTSKRLFDVGVLISRLRDPVEGAIDGLHAIQILGRSDLDEAEVAALVAALDDLDGRWDILRVAAVQGAVFAGASWAGAVLRSLRRGVISGRVTVRSMDSACMVLISASMFDERCHAAAVSTLLDPETEPQKAAYIARELLRTGELPAEVIGNLRRRVAEIAAQPTDDRWRPLLGGVLVLEVLGGIEGLGPEEVETLQAWCEDPHSSPFTKDRIRGLLGPQSTSFEDLRRAVETGDQGWGTATVGVLAEMARTDVATLDTVAEWLLEDPPDGPQRDARLDRRTFLYEELCGAELPAPGS